MSPTSKPETHSLKVKVTEKGTVLHIWPTDEVIVTEAPTLSTVRERTSDGVFPLEALSTATPEPTETVTTPSALGTTSAVYTDPLPLRLETVPLVTLISAEPNPVTSSLKVITIGIIEVFVTAGAVDERVTVGEVSS
jgi:hypothetical protein